MALTLREATAADDAAIGELLVRAFVDSYARKLPEVVVSDQRKAYLRDVASKRAGARVWVADRDGLVVGTVTVWPPGTEGSEAWLPEACDLRQLGVSANARGGVVSKALLDTAEAWARAAGHRAICLHVRQGAHGVARLYVDRGYRRAPEGDLDLRPEVMLEAYWLAL